MEDGRTSGEDLQSSDDIEYSHSDTSTSVVVQKLADSVSQSSFVGSAEGAGQVRQQHVQDTVSKASSNGEHHQENLLSGHLTTDMSETEDGGSFDSPRVIIDDVIPMSCSPKESARAEQGPLPHVNIKLKHDVAGVKASSSSFTTPRSLDSPLSIGSPKSAKQFDPNRGLIDTAAPFESVKEAVSKFGGIVDWKAHKVQTFERRKLVEHELEKLHAEIPEYKKKSDIAEDEKLRVLQELDQTKRLIEELKLNLERVQTEELQAKQDSELAKLRVEEMEHGIADEASVAAKTQLEVAKARHSAAVSELQAVKGELGTLRKEYASLVAEKEEAMKKAEQAVSASKEAEKTVEGLTIELIAAKESLEAAHAAHMEAEEQRIGAAMAREQDSLCWEKELKRADDELQKLNQKVLYTKDLKLKLEIASSLLGDLKAELSAYVESKDQEEKNDGKQGSVEIVDTERKSHAAIQSAVTSAKKELEEVKTNIAKTTSEVNSLKDSVKALQTELGNEKASLAAIRQREGMALVAVTSLEGDLEKTISEIALVQMKEKETKEKLVQIPKQLQSAAQAADDAKLQAQFASEELRKANEELEQAKARASTTQSRLLAAKKEIEASKASEKLALAAIKGLQETASSVGSTDVDSPSGITLSLEEYHELSKRAQEAEEEANLRVAAAFSQVKTAQESEAETMLKLDQVTKEMASRKELLKLAMDKAEKAKEGKLGVEQELRKWRAEHEQRRKAAESNQAIGSSYQPPVPSSDGNKEPGELSPGSPVSAAQSSRLYNGDSDYTSTETKPMKRKKKSIFPRFFMFLGRKKAAASKAV